MDAVLRDKDFYTTSGGGMTISGGEPLWQADFVCELLSLAQEQGIHCVVESSGHASKDITTRVFALADLVLLDWKHSNPALLKHYTGAHLDTILQTLEVLQTLQKPVVLRCPIIPSVNDTQAHFDGIANIARTYKNIQEIHLMPYHTFGSEKNTRLDDRCEGHRFQAPSKEDISQWLLQLQEKVSPLPVKQG